jgi:hypothetical protein
MPARGLRVPAIAQQANIVERARRMKGLMQNQPLLLSSLVRHADRFQGDTEIVSRMAESPIHPGDL